MRPRPSQIGVVDLIESDFAAGAVLISLGALMGKVSPIQMVGEGTSTMVSVRVIS